MASQILPLLSLAELSQLDINPKDQDSAFLLLPMTKAAQRWVRRFVIEKIDGDCVLVEQRHIADIVNDIQTNADLIADALA
jgi:hypothetical protein